MGRRRSLKLRPPFQPYFWGLTHPDVSFCEIVHYRWHKLDWPTIFHVWWMIEANSSHTLLQWKMENSFKKWKCAQNHPSHAGQRLLETILHILPLFKRRKTFNDWLLQVLCHHVGSVITPILHRLQISTDIGISHIICHQSYTLVFF